MYCVQEISPNIHWVGCNDRRLERFENLFPIPNGVSYNAYLIADNKTALLDTVDASVGRQFLENVEHVLGKRPLDYLVICHMEPDHSSVIEELLRRYPDITLVGTAKAFELLSQFYPLAPCQARIQVTDGDELPLGEHTLRFFTAPMVHWPEVVMALETKRNILFSADAFGSFRALSGNLFADEVDFEGTYLEEARRYYANIVGRYGMQVQSVMKKLAGSTIRMICPLHGPIWREDLSYLLDKYDHWSRYEPEQQGVVLLYASMYGNTENAVSALANKLAMLGVRDMRMYDVSKTHPSYLISEAWKYSHLVFASPTYNMNLYYPMDALLREMTVLGLKNRKVAVLGCHSWASAAAREMQALLANMKGMELIVPAIDIRSAPKTESETEIDRMAEAIASSLSVSAR